MVFLSATTHSHVIQLRSAPQFPAVPEATEERTRQTLAPADLPATRLRLHPRVGGEAMRMLRPCHRHTMLLLRCSLCHDAGVLR